MAGELERVSPPGAVRLQIVSTPAGPLFRVNDIGFPQGVMLADGMAEAWAAPALEALTLADLQPLLDGRPEVLLLGTGARMRPLPKALRQAAVTQGIALEPMDSRVAARTFLLLLGERRAVGVALMPLVA